MPKVLVNGINMHYWQLGTGPDVVMLHGLGGNLAVWHLKVLPYLRSGYRITTYDLRGHGRSDMTPAGYTTRDLAEDLLGLLDALGIERAHLVGHSLGGDIVLHFGLLHPDRVTKMVVIEAGLPALIQTYKTAEWEGWTFWADLLEQLTGAKVPPERRQDLEYLLDRSLEVPIMYGPAKGQPRKKETLLRLLKTTSVVRDYEIIGELTVERLAEIAPQTLLVYETHSPYRRSYAILSESLPNCSTVLLPDGEHRHFSLLEQADLVAGHIRGFLDVELPQLAVR